MNRKISIVVVVLLGLFGGCLEVDPLVQGRPTQQMFDLRSERYHGCAYKSDLWESEWSNGGDYAARWFAALVDMCGVPSNGVSSSFFWSVAGLFTKGAVHAERESEVGDVFHWQVHGLRDMFVDVEPALPPEDMIVYSRPMNPGVMMA